MLGSTSSISNLLSAFGVQPGQPYEHIAKTLSATATPRQSQTADTVSISSSAAMLQQFLNSEMQGGAKAESGELDLMGLSQLKQRGEMLASMLQLKMKNFESHLMANVQGAGLPMQEMDIKNGDGGLSVLGNIQNKEAIQNVLGGMQGEFTDIARLAEVLDMLKQVGPDSAVSGLSAAAQYAQQSLSDRASVKKPDGDFILHIMQSGMDFSFE